MVDDRRAAIEDAEAYRRYVIETKEMEDVEDLVFEVKFLKAMHYLYVRTPEYVKNKNYHLQDA